MVISGLLMGGIIFLNVMSELGFGIILAILATFALIFSFIVKPENKI